MTLLSLLILALILDAVIGDPDAIWRRFPHPAALMGRAVAVLDRHLNKGQNRRAKGILALLILLVPAAALGQIIHALPLGLGLELILATILLAQNSLMRHVSAVASGLETSLSEGRKAVAMIVGRDAKALDETGVARSAIESAAENFSDGVVAPAFWFLLFGLPGILVYKLTNTADSMIGYKTEKHHEFGWAAARFDDLLNWIPARLTGLLIAAAHLSPKAMRIMRRDARLHRSPNAGWPEAATAAVLDIAVSGPRSYHGQMTDDPFVNPEGQRDLKAPDIRRAVTALWCSWAVLLACLITAWLILKATT
jgi:adenosylcobinamide-phosphate synthase